MIKHPINIASTSNKVEDKKQNLRDMDKLIKSKVQQQAKLKPDIGNIHKMDVDCSGNRKLNDPPKPLKRKADDIDD